MILTRRKLLSGMAALICAPAIIRVASIMPVRYHNPGFFFDEISQASGAELEILRYYLGLLAIAPPEWYFKVYKKELALKPF